jgi:DNA repair protein RadB
MEDMNGKEPLKSEKIMTGSYDLNKWLDGGYEKGVITLFYGPFASGKSNFVLLAACHNAKKDKKIIFIDTESSFSIDRINQISGDLPEFVLKNILILNPNDFEEQKKIFLNLLREIKKDNNIGMIIVDSITMFYRLELADARKKGLEFVQKINSDLAEQMKILYEIARKKEIPILITSQVYNEFLSEEDWASGKEAMVNLVGGDLLKYWSKCIIELKNKGGKKKAIIKKHRSIPEKELSFEVCNEGIRKKSWF